MKARSTHEAWEMANEMFPTDYSKNDTASINAGYDIYESNLGMNHGWISDLGNRLEINLENGNTVNIWIETENETKTESTEVVITFEADIHTGTLRNNATKHFETSLTLSSNTRLSDISTFERDSLSIIRKVKQSSKKGDWAYVTISKAHYKWTTLSDFHQTDFEIWTGSGSSITEDGIHLNPSEKYNDDLTHDLWLTGTKGALFTELTI